MVAPLPTLAASSDKQFQLAVLSPGAAATPTPTPTPTSGGGAGPPTVLPPQVQPNPFVPGEATVVPYVYVGMLDRMSLELGELGITYAVQPTFVGKTNLAGAVVFLELQSEPARLYTVHATPGGLWEFTPPLPLSLGWHSLAMTAVSPYAPELRASGVFQFQVIPIPLVTEARPPVEAEPRATPVPPPAPPRLPPTAVPPAVPPPVPPPPTPLPPLPTLLDVDVRVQPPNVQVTPLEPLPVDVRLKRLVPDGQLPLELRLKVSDEQGRVVLEQRRSVVVPDEQVLTESLALPPRTPPGRYWVSAEVTTASTTIIAVSPFMVATAAPSLVPAITAMAGPGIQLWLLTALGALFALWWLVEYARSRHAVKVGPDDLARGGMV